MTLVICPECGHDVSLSAEACTNCGRPIKAPPVVERKVVAVVQSPPESSFPPWGIAAIGLMVLLLLGVGYMLIRQSSDTANTNIAVNATTHRPESVRETHTTSIPPSGVTQAPVVPSAPTSSTTVPGTTTAAPVAPPSDKG